MSCYRASGLDIPFPNPSNMCIVFGPFSRSFSSLNLASRLCLLAMAEMMSAQQSLMLPSSKPFFSFSASLLSVSSKAFISPATAVQRTRAFRIWVSEIIVVYLPRGSHSLALPYPARSGSRGSTDNYHNTTLTALGGSGLKIWEFSVKFLA